MLSAIVFYLGHYTPVEISWAITSVMSKLYMLK